jgi:ribonuclease D
MEGGPPKTMSHIHVQSPDDADSLVEALADAPRLALDCEAAGFHRYSDRLCLVQLSVGHRTFVVDPLAFDIRAILRGPLENPDVGVVMHGADFDLRLLSRDLGIRIRGLVDTQVQASLMGVEGLGLASLLEAHFGVKLSKKYQRADWAERPLTDGMLAYAADDTRYLERLTDVLDGELARLGRQAWAEEEYLAMEAISDEAREADEVDEDPVVRVKGARDLTPRQVAALREALDWRDEIARRLDRAPFRVIGDPPLIEAALGAVPVSEALTEIRGFPRGLAREHGAELVRRLEAVALLPESDVVGYPRHVRRGPGRPPPELEAAVDQLKAVRNRRADEIGLPKGTLMSNALLLAVARAAPATMEELLAVEGMRMWKAQAAGEGLLKITRTL